MYTKADLFKGLAELGIKSDDRVLIHSSYKSVGDFEGGPAGLIRSLIEYFSEEGLLIFPTHTWRQINDENPICDYATEKSCIGILPDFFLAEPGVIRSIHPTHSVAAIGQGAEAYVAGEEKMVTPCGDGGCWQKLIPLEAKIIFLGATLKTNTFIHGVEEIADIPNRLTEEQDLLKVRVGERLYETPQYRHIGNVSETYDKLQAPLVKRGIARVGKLGDARTIVCEAAPMAAYVLELLEREPNIFGHEEPIPIEWY